MNSGILIIIFFMTYKINVSKSDIIGPAYTSYTSTPTLKSHNK